MAKKMTHCPTCKKRFEDIGEGWRVIMGCPRCGLRQADAERVHNQDDTDKSEPEAQKPSKPVQAKSYKSLHLTRSI